MCSSTATRYPTTASQGRARRVSWRLAAAILAVVSSAIGAGPRPALEAPPQQPPASTFILLDEVAAAAILDEISGVRARRYVTTLTRFDRISASAGYTEAAQWLLTELAAGSVLRVDIERYGPDAPQPLRRVDPPTLPRWTVNRAELRLVEPYDRLIVSYAETPIALARYSRPAQVTAPLVDVGNGTRDADYQTIDVVGKLVLASGFSSSVERLAVGKYGAAGVVIFGASSYDRWKGWGHPGMLTWQVLAPGEYEGREPTFAFSISDEQGTELRSELAAGHRLVLSATIDAELSPGTQEVVTAVIPGTTRPEEEVLLLGHLDHVRPSANDNASGSAVLLEVARSLDALISSGRLAAPSRSIRFLWMTEGAGTYAWIQANPGIGARVLSAINLDMVGEGPLPGTGPLNIRRPPDSLPSYILDVLMNAVAFLDRRRVRAPTGSESLLNVRVKPFSPDSDHYILNDGAVRIPTLLVNYGPDPFHHTNFDAPDAVDPTTLQRICFIAAASAYLVASADDETATRIAMQVFAAGARRLADAAAEGLGMIGNVPLESLDEAYWLAERKLHHVAARESAAVRSVTEISPAVEPEVDAAATLIEAQRSGLDRALGLAYAQRAGELPGQRPLSESERTAAGIVPRRTAPYLNERWTEEIDAAELDDSDRAWLARFQANLAQSYIRIPELLNLMDGVRSLLEIRDALSAEDFDFMRETYGIGTPSDGSLEYRRIPMDGVLRLVRTMERAGMVSLQEQR